MKLTFRTESARTVAGTALTGSYADVGSVTSDEALGVAIINGCDEDVVVSWDDGATDGFHLPANSSVSIGSKTLPYGFTVLPKGAQFRAKHAGSAPTSGTLSIMVVVK